VPAVFLNVMRGGPGLGNIGPEQADIKLVCRGLGHGNTHAIVLVPTTPQQMLDLTREAFRLAFRYRNPVVVLADGYLGQMTGRVRLPSGMTRPGVPAWAVWGDAAHRRNLINSIQLDEGDLEKHNEALCEKYARMSRHEQRAETYRTEDAEILVVACNTPARLAKGAIESVRREGIAAGLFQPVTLWPFPVEALSPLVERAPDVLVVEASGGQLEDELRLALSHEGSAPPRIHNLRRMGGMLPQKREIEQAIREVRGGVR
jgi:pyruvate/2-oxoacid:ferredoxin oxidoreductase alpha subunit